jgi:hypothetical protein
MIEKLLSGALGGLLVSWIAWSQLRESKIHEYRAKDHDKALKDLWLLTSNLPLRPIRFDLTYKDLKSLTVGLKDWYFAHGHLISESCQTQFNQLQNLTIKSVKSYEEYLQPKVLEQSDLKKPLHPLVYIHCQVHCSLLRHSLVRHFGTRGYWSISHRVLSIYYRHVRKEGYCKKYLVSLESFIVQMPRDYKWIGAVEQLAQEAGEKSEISKLKNKRRKLRKDKILQVKLHFNDLHLVSKHNTL